MKINKVKGVDISVLSLGTVQLGLNYGINNAGGKPSREKAHEVLDAAMTGGITALDTAAGYGDSEEVIGSWLAERNDKPFVMTKVSKLDHSSFDALRDGVFASVESSKKRLGLKQLPLLMLHNCDDYLCDKENMKRIFAELKDRGDILFSGISAYAHHDYGEIADSGFDATQIPANVFDWRQIESGGIQRLQDAGMMVFIRSVYLQGLVFQTPDKMDPRMEFARKTIENFYAICKEFNLSPAVLALSYALSLPGATSLVLGSETPEQVTQNVELLDQTVTLTPEQMALLQKTFRDTEDRILNPGLWFNAYK